MLTHKPCFTSIHKLVKLRFMSSVIRQEINNHSSVHKLFDKSPLRVDNKSVHRSMLDGLRKNLPIQALDVFKTQIQLGIGNAVDEVVVSLALKACRGDLFLGSQIHALSVTSGFCSYVTVCNSLMNMYCKGGSFSEALCMFESLTDPDIVSWNTVLSGFDRSHDVMEFACRMNSSGVVFDAVTYTTVLSMCSTIEEFRFALQLHCCILKFGLDCENFVGNALISMYSRWGRLLEARRVFDELSNKDLVSWNAMISGYSQEGIYGLEAALVFVEMVRSCMELDHVSFTGAVSACGHERNIELGRQIHGLSVKQGYDRQVSVGNVLISTYSKCGLIEDGKLVFQVMGDHNVVSWTTMISIDEENAVSLFNEMRLDGVYPNAVTFVSLIHAITIRDVAEGKMVHGSCLKTGFSTTPEVCNSLITMYAKFKSMQAAEQVFEEIDYREIITWNAVISGYAQNGYYREAIQKFSLAIVDCKPNQYTFGSALCAIGAAEDISSGYGQRCHSQIIKLGLDTDPVVSGAVLDMYAKRGSIQESQRIFSEMPQRSQLSWTTIISAHARHGNYESVILWFEEMEKEGVKPDSITFLSLLTACARKGMVNTGRHLFDKMIHVYGIEPSSEHYSCMVDMLGRVGQLDEAEKLMNQIPGGPSLSVLQSLLGSCRIHGNVEMGEKVANALMGMEPTESGSYVLMSNLYAEKGKWDMVAKLRKQMREKGVKKEIGFSWVDVGGRYASLSLHGFSSGDKSHPESESIYRMAQCLGSEMNYLRRNQSILSSKF